MIKWSCFHDGLLRRNEPHGGARGRGISGQLRECGGGCEGMGSRADLGGSLGLVVVTGRAAAAWD